MCIPAIAYPISAWAVLFFLVSYGKPEQPFEIAGHDVFLYISQESTSGRTHGHAGLQGWTRLLNCMTGGAQAQKVKLFFLIVSDFKMESKVSRNPCTGLMFLFLFCFFVCFCFVFVFVCFIAIYVMLYLTVSYLVPVTIRQSDRAVCCWCRCPGCGSHGSASALWNVFL